jgi:hypothetical protein
MGDQPVIRAEGKAQIPLEHFPQGVKANLLKGRPRLQVTGKADLDGYVLFDEAAGHIPGAIKKMETVADALGVQKIKGVKDRFGAQGFPGVDRSAYIFGPLFQELKGGALGGGGMFAFLPRKVKTNNPQAGFHPQLQGNPGQCQGGRFFGRTQGAEDDTVFKRRLIPGKGAVNGRLRPAEPLIHRRKRRFNAKIPATEQLRGKAELYIAYTLGKMVQGKLLGGLFQGFAVL